MVVSIIAPRSIWNNLSTFVLTSLSTFIHLTVMLNYYSLLLAFVMIYGLIKSDHLEEHGCRLVIIVFEMDGFNTFWPGNSVFLHLLNKMFLRVKVIGKVMQTHIEQNLHHLQLNRTHLSFVDAFNVQCTLCLRNCSYFSFLARLFYFLCCATSFAALLSPMTKWFSILFTSAKFGAKQSALVYLWSGEQLAS